MLHRRFGAKSGFFSFSRILSAVFGLTLLAFLVYASGSLEKTSGAEQKNHLEQAIRRSAVHCYATEGAYPQSLAYLRENYGIRYDEKKYLVDYQVFASNIMPEITVITRHPS